MSFIASLFFIGTVLTPEQAFDIGVRVWQNECSGTIIGLTSWNEGEEFASMGIGHFIWYPTHQKHQFVETFPELVQFLKGRGVEIPRWIEEARGCPWKNRDQFLRAARMNAKQMVELRDLLKNTVPLQVQYMYSRLDIALPLLIAHAPKEDQIKIGARYDRIYAHPNGPFVLLDYVNFKGYGTSKAERYDDLGWGLYQVLDNMSDDPKTDPITAFVESAKTLLEKRVNNAPSNRNEKRFLIGWIHRLESYTQTT